MADMSDDRLRRSTSFPELLGLLRDGLNWPVGLDDFAEETFDYGSDRPGGETDAVRGIVAIRPLRPVTSTPPWGIFFLEFGAAPLSTVALRGLLRMLVARQRRSAEAAHHHTWHLEDLLFICFHRDEQDHAVTFVHFSQSLAPGNTARLTSFGWTERSHRGTVGELILPALRWPEDTADAAAWREQWSHAFDKQELTAVFWREYRALFESLQADLFAQTKDRAWAHDFTLRFLNRCLFLCLIQQKRWLGGDPNFLGTFWAAYAGARQEKDTFYERWLKVLFLEVSHGGFHDGPAQFPAAIEAALRRALRLGSDLFTENDLDRRHEFLLRDAQFLQVLTFLDRYPLALSEDTPLEQQMAVDAEMLGRVYESLINPSEAADARRDAGVFYTPRMEIDLMCRLSLVDYLANHLGAARKGLLYEALFACGPEEKRAADGRLAREDLWTQLDSLLQGVTVLDPACGSGSFLVGMLQVLDDLAERANRVLSRQETPYERRQRIICRSLHGMDVMRWALEVAELRLGLQLVVVADSTSAAAKSRPLLPDLSCNLRCGDSLIEEWSPARIFASPQNDEDFGVAASRPKVLGMADNPPAFFPGSRVAPAHPGTPEGAYGSPPGRHFDIVIGNPPYVRQEKIGDPMLPREKATTDSKKQYKARLAAAIYRAWPSFFGAAAGRGTDSRRLNAQSDLYVYFFFRALSFLNEKGTFCFLTSNSWLDVAYGADLQEFLLRRCHVKMILDNQARRSFASADVNTVITLLSPPSDRHDGGLEQTARFVMFFLPFERALAPAVFQEIETATERTATPVYRVFPIRQDRLLEDGSGPAQNESARASCAQAGRFPSRSLLPPTGYVGGKWGGQFLRAPEVFHRIRETAGGRLVPLGRLGKVRYPIKTGINEFFYPDESRIVEFGIDRRFLVKVVKSPREFRSIRLREDDVSRFLFSCPLSCADLAARGCSGTLTYIQWGAGQKTTARQKSAGGVPWPEAPSVQGRPQWYSIDPLPPADVICNRFFHDRFFFGFADFPIVEDQTFYGCTFTLPETCRRAQIAILNSTLQFLFVELLGRIALGEGVLQYATYEMAQMLTLDARRLTEQQRDAIVRAFAPLAERPLTRIEQEITSCDRRVFDDCVFDTLGLTPRERAAVYEAVANLVSARLQKAESLRRGAAGKP